jgi:hypothetical protein
LECQRCQQIKICREAWTRDTETAQFQAHFDRSDAEKSAPEIAREAVERVCALYAVERQGKDASRRTGFPAGADVFGDS